VKIGARKRPLQDLVPLHDLYRQEANCQLIHDSFWSRALLDAYAIHLDDQLAGYGAVANRYDQGTVIEFYTFPHRRRHAMQMFAAFLLCAKATHIAAQTNVPLLLMMFHEYVVDIHAEKVLFSDAHTSRLTCPRNGVFRERKDANELPIFEHHHEPTGNGVIEAEGEIVATGGFLTHYNPPYADLYMEVAEAHRKQGFGSYLIQGLKKTCYEHGKRPAARCDLTNVASSRTPEKAGLLACGHLLVGIIK
jgi:hypothetical protein